MIETINFLTLQNRFKQIKELYSSDRLKYIHIKSIDNFLFYADSFYMNHHKEEIHKTLSEYFDIISSTQVNNIRDSLQLFNKYIIPLTDLYKDLKGFKPILHSRTIIIWTLPILVLLFLLKSGMSFYIGLVIVVCFVFVRQLYYIRLKKAYGLMY